MMFQLTKDAERSAKRNQRKGGMLGVVAASVWFNKHDFKSATSRYPNDQCCLPQPFPLNSYNVTSCLAQATMPVRTGMLFSGYRHQRGSTEANKKAFLLS
jgi:hypothetical protein